MACAAFMDQRPIRQLTLGDLLERYAQEVTPTKKGYESKQYRIRAFLQDPLARTKLADLTGRRIALWRDQRLTEIIRYDDEPVP